MDVSGVGVTVGVLVMVGVTVTVPVLVGVGVTVGTLVDVGVAVGALMIAVGQTPLESPLGMQSLGLP